MPDIIINGAEGRIEASYLQGNDPYAPMALILHHHPNQGGRMNDKLAYTLFDTFAKRGFNTLRFNFRGVGKSEGRFSQGEGELSDAASVLDWMHTYNTNASECWVAGSSFGAWIGMQLLMRRPELKGFIAVSPPANLHDFSFLAPCPVSGLILQGELDQIVPKNSIDDLVHKLSLQKNIVVERQIIEGADHFFTDKLATVGLSINQYLEKIKTPQVLQKA